MHLQVVGHYHLCQGHNHNMLVFLSCKDQVVICRFSLHLNIKDLCFLISRFHIISMSIVSHQEPNQIVTSVYRVSSLFIVGASQVFAIGERDFSMLCQYASNLHIMGCQQNFLACCNLNMSLLLKDSSMHFLGVSKRIHHQN